MTQRKKTTDRLTKLSSLETAFIRLWKLKFGPLRLPLMQYRFAAPDRQWRFDFSWIPQKVAVEIVGGIWTGGGHNRGLRITKDCEKENFAVIHGWSVLKYTTLDLRTRPDQVAEEIWRLLDKKESVTMSGADASCNLAPAPSKNGLR